MEPDLTELGIVGTTMPAEATESSNSSAGRSESSPMMAHAAANCDEEAQQQGQLDTAQQFLLAMVGEWIAFYGIFSPQPIAA
jgi:hypothetical protein